MPDETEGSVFTKEDLKRINRLDPLALTDDEYYNSVRLVQKLKVNMKHWHNCDNFIKSLGKSIGLDVHWRGFEACVLKAYIFKYVEVD